MEKKRKVYAPFSLTSEAGVAQTPVEGYIDVNQVIYPTVNTGTVNENGRWTGVKSSDSEFIGLSKAEAVANGATVLFPDTNAHPSINMDGFTEMFIAIKTTRQGDYAIEAVFGPDTVPFANLSPVNSGIEPRGNEDFSSQIEALVKDSAETLTADVFDIFKIDRLRDQRNLQFKITNNAGGSADLEFGFMRLV